MNVEELSFELTRHPPAEGEIIALHFDREIDEEMRLRVMDVLKELGQRVNAGYVVLLEPGAWIERI